MPNRRHFLKCTLAAAAASMLPWEPTVINAGWMPSKFRLPKTHAHRNKGKGKITLLWKYLEAVTGQPMPCFLQQYPDCVGWAGAISTDVLTAVQVFHRGDSWPGFTACEPIYGGSRVEIGKGMVLGAGSHCGWAGAWLKQYGTLLRKQYGDHDLTIYDPDKCDRWGEEGVPDELEPFAQYHPVKTIEPVESWEETRDSIAGGYPVMIGSKQGFCEACGRDEQGFMHPKGKWHHAMIVIGADDTDRPGGLLYTPWGPKWGKGPKRFDQPDCSFWVDAHVIDKMVKQGDSNAISNFVGYPARRLAA